MLILYLACLFTALYFVIKMLGPEFAKPASSKAALDSEIKIALDSKPKITIDSWPKISFNFKPKNILDADPITEADGDLSRIARLEILLAEKNKNITLLQKELMSIHLQLRDFDKIKTVQEEEIQRLREQNRIFRSEFGISPASSVERKENSIT